MAIIHGQDIRCAYTKLILVKDLVPHLENENKHSEDQIRALADIIAKDGMRHPIIVSNLSGTIAAGHGRRLALMLLGWEYAPVDFQDFDDPIQELRVRNADNQIAKYAEFNREQFELNLKNLDLDIKEIDMREYGILDFIIVPEKFNLDDDSPKEEKANQYRIEVKFVNEMDMMDLYDDLISKNYLARIVK
jgi:hypothetical protein